jgi:peptidoglycan/xylan/chitin deacetylase (PgdA/CDA1 family)
MKLPIERFDYSGISTRPKLDLPNDARIAVYLVVNVEDWDIEMPVAREYFGAPQGVATVPNIPNWSWHEYGMRVGFWRLFEAIQARGIRATTAINARVCEYQYEPVARAMRDAGWEFMGHGYRQRAMHVTPNQAEVIKKTYDVIHRYTGKPPKGWLGPGLHETWETLDLLADTGFKYVVDWALDDHPFDLKTASGPIASVPYNFELSDLPMMVAHQHESSIWLSRTKDQFDCLYSEGAKQPRVMSMSVHPYIIGAPHRLKYFAQALDYILSHDGVWFTTAEEVYELHRSNRALS